MSKLKPIKDDAELAKVPLDEPVLVELEPAATGAEPNGDAALAQDDGADRKPAAKDKGGEGASALERQLAAAQEAERLQRERADNAERLANAANKERDQLRTEHADTEKELLTSSLSAAQSDAAAAKAAYKAAFEAGDADAMAEAQEKISRAAAQTVQFEGALASFEQEAKAPKVEAELKTDAPVDIITAIDRDPKLLPKEREWLKEHPEVLTDTALNAELTVGYNRAMRQGFKRGTEGYFKFLNEFLGYEKADQGGENDTDNSGEAAIVSAPVTRDSRSSLTNRPQTPTQIRLSPEQRQLARDMGISDAAYARGVLKLESNKKSDPERYSGRQ